MALWNRQFVNEAEGGAPDASDYGQAFRRARLQQRPSYTVVDEEIAGTHPSSPMDGSILGAVGRGSRAVFPIVKTRGFLGELPLREMPIIEKPLAYK